MLFPSGFLGVLTLIVLLPCFDCITNNICKENPPNSYLCTLKDGSKINISSLGLKNKPGFSDQNGDYTYTYNPRYNFTIDDNACKDAAACQTPTNPGTSYLLATQEVDSWSECTTYISKEKATCINFKKVTITTTERKAIIELICDSKADKSEFKFEKEDHLTYYMSLKSKYACATTTSRLSFGSVLCITFSVLVIVYVVVGILVNRFVRGANGLELFPNYQFWSGFPSLVKDGILFSIKPCKKESDYDAI